jgi:hypothetical protein
MNHPISTIPIEDEDTTAYEQLCEEYFFYHMFRKLLVYYGASAGTAKGADLALTQLDILYDDSDHLVFSRI